MGCREAPSACAFAPSPAPNGTSRTKTASLGVVYLRVPWDRARRGRRRWIRIAARSASGSIRLRFRYGYEMRAMPGEFWGKFVERRYEGDEVDVGGCGNTLKPVLDRTGGT